MRKSCSDGHVENMCIYTPWMLNFKLCLHIMLSVFTFYGKFVFIKGKRCDSKMLFLQVSCHSDLAGLLDVCVCVRVCVTGGVQCRSAVVAECGAGVGCHRGAVGRAGHRAETRCRTGSLRRRRPAGAERCVLNMRVIKSLFKNLLHKAFAVVILFN